MMGKKRHLFLVMGLVIVALIALCGYQRFKGRRIVAKTTELAIENREATVTALRNGLRNHAKQITISFETTGDADDQIEALAAELVEEALAETDNPTEGDYIRFQYGGYQVRYSHTESRNGYQNTVKIIPDYYTYYVQEEQVSVWVNEILQSFHFDENTSEFEIIKTIYQYVYDNVSYDKVHKEKRHKHLKTTAYAALKYRAAVCQGYAVLMYRLLREAGIRTRIITGEAVTASGETERHAWNLVECGGLYYHVDVTLDKAQGAHDFFMKAENDFPGHIRDEQYETEDFISEYRMADESYKERMNDA